MDIAVFFKGLLKKYDYSIDKKIIFLRRTITMPEVVIYGPEGRLEGRYMPGVKLDSPCAVLFHPNPQQGGTMNNKVMFNLFHCFAKQGCHVLRFNFRGVGKSEGSFAKGEGELTDAATVLDWMQQHHTHSRRFWIAGFSFGAWIAMQLLMRRPEIFRFIAVAPPVNLYDFSFLAPCPTSGLIMQGSADSIVPYNEQEKLVEKLQNQPGIKIEYAFVKRADHFFSNNMAALQRLANQYIAKENALAEVFVPPPDVLDNEDDYYEQLRKENNNGTEDD
ncbi:MAG: alpha/beta hydrolase [Alphaproteobacteria bacterium]